MKVALFVLASVMTSYVVLGAPPQIPPGIEKKLEAEAEAKLAENLKLKLEEIVKEKAEIKEQAKIDEKVQEMKLNTEERLKTAEAEAKLEENLKVKLEEKGKREKENAEVKAQAKIDEKVQEMKLNAAEQLMERLKTILVHAELEMEEMEIKSEIIQKLKDHPNVFNPEQLTLLNRLVENMKAQGRDIALEPMLLDKILLEDTPVKAEELVKKIESDRSSAIGDIMTLEQKMLEARLAQRAEMSHQELLRLAELRSRRSGATTLQEFLLIHHRQQTDKILLEEELLKKIESDRSSPVGDIMTLEQKMLEARLAQRAEMSHQELLRLAELRSRRSGATILQELLLIHHRQQTDKILLEEELLKKIESDRSSPIGDIMTLEQKMLEARLAQRAEMSHQELLRLAELRSRRSGATTLQELFLIHHREQTFTPRELILLRSITPNQILKFYFLQNAEDMTSRLSTIESLMKQLSEISHIQSRMESHKVLLYNLIKNKENQPSLSLAQVELIQSYHQSLVQSLRRSMSLLVMRVMDIESSGSVTTQEKELLVVLVRRVEEVQMELSMLMNIEEVALLRRLDLGGVGMIEKLAIHSAEESPSLRSALRALVMNKLRVDLVKGFGLALNPSGDWMPQWMSDEEWMNATNCERTLELWTLYKLRHNRNFRTRLEDRIRRRHFEKRVSEIVTHNIEFQLGRQIFSMGLNNHSDRTDSEMAGLKGYMNTTQLEAQLKADAEAQAQDVAQAKQVKIVIPNMPTYTNTIPTSQLPTYVNWTTTGWVGPIQNQGQCGSCWSFSAAGSLEAQYYNKTKTFVALSEQNLVDCTYYLGNMGCSGGYVALAFDYVMNVGIDTNASYPYTARLNNGVCKYNAANSVTQDSGWMNIPTGNEAALQQAVAMVGPVSVAIDASLSSFDSYTSGVYAPTNCSTTALDHAVLVVGYGTTTQGQDYWLIKNSWGTQWGMDGYMMMLRGVNMCGIATDALFPLIN